MQDKKNREIVYAFIDSQNLNLGVKSQGWGIDFRKFRQYLRNKYNVSKAYLFIGQLAGNESLYASLQESGFILIFKPTLDYRQKDKLMKIKGNVDAELVLHTMIQYKNYDKAILVSGDGDFHCLVEYLEQQGKLFHILTPNRHYSGLLRKYNKFIVRVDLLKNSLQLQKKTEISGRSKP